MGHWANRSESRLKALLYDSDWAVTGQATGQTCHYGMLLSLGPVVPSLFLVFRTGVKFPRLQ